MNDKYRFNIAQSFMGNLSFLLFCLLLCMSTSGDCSAERDNSQVRRKIIAAIPPDFPPTYFRDETTGQPAGFSVDVMNEVARRAGFDVEYIFAESWDMLEQAVLSEKADLVPNLSIVEKRLKNMIFTVPVETLKISLIPRASDTANNRIEAGMKIGVMKGSSADHFLSKRIDIIIYPYPGLQQLLLDLLAGRIDLAMTAAPNILKMARDAGIEERIRIIEPCEYEAKRGMALRPGNEALRDQLDAVIEEFIGTLEYQQLYQKWWGKPTPFWNTRRVAWTISGIGTALIMIFLAWHFRETKRAEAALQESEEKFRNFADQSLVGICLIQDRIFKYVNPKFSETFGYTVEQCMSNMSFDTLVHPEDQNIVAENIRKRLSGEVKNVHYEFRGVKKNNEIISLEIFGSSTLLNGKVGAIGTILDITERKRVDENLRRNIVKQRAMVANIADVIAIVDQDGINRYKSPNIEKWFGWRPDEIVGAHIWDVIHPKDLDPFQQFFATILNDPEAASTVECRYKCKNGAFKWVKITAVNLVSNTDINGVLLNYHDISNRKQTEDALRASRRQLTDIIEFLPDATVAVDREKRVIIWNKAIEKMTGVPAAEMIGKGDNAYAIPFYGETRPLLMDFIFREYGDMPAWYPDAALEGDSLTVEVYCNALYNNKGAWVYTKASPLHDQSGNIVGAIESIRDITERKYAEETIRKISSAVEQSPVAIVITDTTGAIEYVNPKFTETTGYTSVEAMGQNPRILKSGNFPPEAYKELWDTILAGDIWRGEFHNKKKNGQLYWEHASISPVRDTQGVITSFVAVKEDITDRKRAEEELLHLNETLEQRVAQEVEKNLRQEHLLIQQSRLAAMGEMIGNIAHQWRQPLNALGILLFNIKDEYHFNTLDAAYLDQAVADGSRMVQKMSTTISDFANFFRPDKEIKIFSALEQIKEAIALVESSFQSSHISIHIDAPLDLKLLGFPNEYSQVLLNLLTNAKEAILAHNQPHADRVDIILAAQDGHGCVSVCDNGGGIPEEILGRIFDPYFSTKGKGSGIGLYMSKMIIERNMNGSITARNIEGGAEFSVCTPLA